MPKALGRVVAGYDEVGMVAALEIDKDIERRVRWVRNRVSDV